MTTQLIQLPDMSRTARAVQDMREGVFIPKTTAAERAQMQQMHARNRELQSRIIALEAAESARQETLIVKAQRLAYMESKTAHVRDNTASYKTPSVIATTDAVHLALPLNPRTAIPMALPVFSQIRNWLHLKW
ncbi:hypothetical protein CCP3SC15_990013 [Gammaproteobacteria bacterium]